MTDFDSIWRTQDEIRTVVNAVLGECIWKLSFNEQRIAIELELTNYLEEEDADMLVNFHRSLWVMRSWCRMVHSWSMVMRCRFVHVRIVRAVNPVVTILVCYEQIRTIKYT